MFSCDVKWVRMFDIPDISKHKQGFTVYKVISMLYPEHCPNAVTKITVWKRFNDFKTLHKDIKTLHKTLKIPDQVPSLPTSTYFKRFDEDVIQHRKSLILELLEYISVHSQLFTSNVFVKFFETSHTPEGGLIGGDSDDDCTISDDTDSLSTVSSSMIQLTDDTGKVDEYPIKFQLFLGELQMYSCELFGNSLGSELIESEYVCHADRFFELATEIESVHREFKVAWRHYMQGIYVLLKYGREDNVSDRKLIAKFKLEKCLIRLEKLFYLNLFEEIKSYIVSRFGEPFANLVLADLNNLHFEQLFDLQRFEPMPPQHLTDEDVDDDDGGSELVLRAEVGALPLLSYSLTAVSRRAGVGGALPDADDFALAAHRFEGERNYAAAYVNYKLAHKRQHQQHVGKDLGYLLRNAKCVYRSGELRAGMDVHSAKEPAHKECQRADLYNYKVTALLDKNAMVVVHVQTGLEYVVNVVQKSIEFSSDCIIFPKHVPYMTKLQRWHYTEDAIFLLFIHSSATKITEYLSKATHAADIPCDRITKDGCDNELQLSHHSLSDEFEFLDLPSSTSLSGLVETDEYDECCCKQQPVPIERIRRWTAQVVLALEHLHKCGVICCDLKIDDLKIDDRGDVLMDYKCKIDRQGVFASRELTVMAPEVYTFEMVTPAVDWWSLGLILHELLSGIPIHSVNLDGAYPSIKLPAYLPPDAKSLIKQLLVCEPSARLGAAGSEEVKSHPYFNSIRWESM